MNIQNDSPQFSQLISWLKKENLQELRKFFPLINMDTWFRRKYRSKYYSYIDLTKLRDEIYSELINPLFIKHGINTKDLSGHFRAFLKELKRDLSWNEVQDILRKFHSDFAKIAPKANLPLLWILKGELNPEEKEYCDNESDERLRQDWETLEKKLNRIAKELDEFEFYSLHHQTYMEMERVEKERAWLERQKRRDLVYDQKIKIAAETINFYVKFLEIAKGKPGRHPKPFNIFVYHLINKNKCTRRKIDENRNYVYQKDGLHKLERDWKLILFLILDFYVKLKKKNIRLPDLDAFVSKNKLRPAHMTLRDLKSRLWNIYKNFPPNKGWPFPRSHLETGFRKLIIADDGRLQIVRL